MKKVKGRGPSRTETWVPTDRPFLVWINVYFYVNRCVHRVYYGYLGNARKHAQPGRPEAVTERRLV
jgi:hypothetical protein